MEQIENRQIVDMFLEPSLVSAQSLLSLVNDILDASLVKANKFNLKI